VQLLANQRQIDELLKRRLEVVTDPLALVRLVERRQMG
jgi:hypothetical protein